ncbi:MAG: hypothetical protein SAJ12_11720 [Jaaginema sp. PMC 1079.18]|nr:hypothetical protein [Jaaginema sp. PMC 1080.18]MEC4851673.1 hypothetical protein [Jaaginema sp. PMC 1079.18]MEC4868095.1 hypothetical protein [Jaaginema sp. PMC 1078.18]
MIQLVVGWVKDFLNFSDFHQKETIKVSKSEAGYIFEHEELKRLMDRLKNFETVEFTDVSGTRLTPESIKERFGPDGGIDCIIRIVAPTERGASNVATRIRNILIRGDY